MGDEAEGGGLRAFEARLAALADKVRAGFPERARELREAVERLSSDEQPAREAIKRYAHKVRGTAGSHGFGHLTELAAKVEGLALGAPREAISLEAFALADALARDAPAAPEPASEVRPPAAAATLAGLRIVAVDDDVSTRKLLGLTLINVGRAEAVVEERGAALLERLRAGAYDVVIVDAMMPAMNGLACLERIVAEGLHREATRYFVLSAATAEELAWVLPRELSIGWLRKPFRPRELVDALALQLAR